MNLKILKNWVSWFPLKILQLEIQGQFAKKMAFWWKESVRVFGNSTLVLSPQSLSSRTALRSASRWGCWFDLFQFPLLLYPDKRGPRWGRRRGGRLSFLVWECGGEFLRNRRGHHFGSTLFPALLLVPQHFPFNQADQRVAAPLNVHGAPGPHPPVKPKLRSLPGQFGNFLVRQFTIDSQTVQMADHKSKNKMIFFLLFFFFLDFFSIFFLIFCFFLDFFWIFFDLWEQSFAHVYPFSFTLIVWIDRFKIQSSFHGSPMTALVGSFFKLKISMKIFCENGKNFFQNL